MSVLNLPLWIEPNLFNGKSFDDLSEPELTDLKHRISRFKANDPDVSIVIPAWNEERNIFRTLSSLASNKTDYKVEIIVINNNSTDNTQKILDELGVINYLEAKQGISHARQCGLEKARGKYHLCSDSDTLYPPQWINLMVGPMVKDKGITGVYGRYSFIPPKGEGRLGLMLYEFLTGILIRIQKKNREYMVTLGFNMGFVTEIGRVTGGFNVKQMRMFDNEAGSEYFVHESEDGVMALNLKKKGNLKLVTHPKARVFTSPRRLLQDGSIDKAFWNRIKLHVSKMRDYLFKKR